MHDEPEESEPIEDRIKPIAKHLAYEYAVNAGCDIEAAYQYARDHWPLFERDAEDALGGNSDDIEDLPNEEPPLPAARQAGG